MKTVVYFYMKGAPLQRQTFDTLKEAQLFMLILNENPECEAYGIERSRA